MFISRTHSWVAHMERNKSRFLQFFFLTLRAIFSRAVCGARTNRSRSSDIRTMTRAHRARTWTQFKWLCMKLTTVYAQEYSPCPHLHSFLLLFQFLLLFLINIARLPLAHDDDDLFPILLLIFPRFNCPLTTTRAPKSIIEANHSSDKSNRGNIWWSEQQKNV